MDRQRNVSRRIDACTATMTRSEKLPPAIPGVEGRSPSTDGAEGSSSEGVCCPPLPPVSDTLVDAVAEAAAEVVDAAVNNDEAEDDGGRGADDSEARKLSFV